ncbi:MAG: murein hydrolase activator EnvC family protein [Bradyrhizobium sp.]
MQRAPIHPSHHDTVRRCGLSSLPLSLLLLLSPLTAAAQTMTTPPKTATADLLQQRQQELDAVRARQSRATASQAKLKAEIAAIGQDRSKLNQQLIDGAARVRASESSIAEAEGRLRTLDARRQQIKASLDSRRSEVIEVLAALQRASRQAPPALLVRPEDALESLRTAMMLGTVVPALRARAEKLAAELSSLMALRKAIASDRNHLAADRGKLKSNQTRLAALIDERQRQQADAEKDMQAQSARAIALAKQVDDLQSLIIKMEEDVASAAKAAAIAKRRGVPRGKPDLAALKNPNRLSPAIAFAAAKGLFTLPVDGTMIRDFGSSDGAGGREKGISLATSAGATVTTPCDGWVVYAGPFRSYGQLLILNAGGGYHVLIAGMKRISVNIGQFVLAGEPIATMGATSKVASIFAPNASRPVLYIEFRKGGTSIDPGPWWAAKQGEKVRG